MLMNTAKAQIDAQAGDPMPAATLAELWERVGAHVLASRCVVPTATNHTNCLLYTSRCV